MRRLDRKDILLVGVLFVLGLTLRLGGIGWGLPDKRHPLASYHPDEMINLNASMQADLLRGKLDIGFYNYGTLYFYVVSVAHSFGRGYGLIPSTPSSPPPASEIEGFQRQHPEIHSLLLTGRVVTALFGAFTIPVLYALGFRLRGRLTGAICAGLFAILPLPVVHSHFLTVDVPCTFFVSLALLQTTTLKTRPLWKQALLCGIWVGLASATKYSAGLVLIAPVSAMLLATFQKPSNRSTRWTLKELMIGLVALFGAVTVSFLIACPGPWLNWKVFWEGTYPGSGVHYELFVHSRQGHGYLFANTGIGWFYHLVVSLPVCMSYGGALLALLGVIRALLRRQPNELPFLVFLIGSFVITGLSEVRFSRYLIPLMPAACLFAALLLTEKLPQRRLDIAKVALGVVAMGFTFLCSLLLVMQMLGRDARDEAADSLEQQATQKPITIAFARIPWFHTPPLSPYWGAVNPQSRATSQEHGNFKFRIPTTEWDTNLLDLPSDIVLLSNYELQHEVVRLKQSRAVQFVNAASRKGSEKIYGNTFVEFLFATPYGIPEDLLYILPRIYVYKNP